MAPQREWFDTDYYAVLGVASDASDKDVTRAYRKLAKQYHPDANPGNKDAEERFKEVSAANDVLSDPEKRKEYDEVRRMVASGAYAGGPGGPGGGFGFNPGGSGGGFQFDDTVDLGDLLGGLFNRGGGGQARGFGGGGGRRAQRHAPQRGADLESEITIDFLDAVQRHHHVGVVHRRGRVLRVPRHRRAAGHLAAGVHRVRRLGRGRDEPGVLLDRAGVPGVSRPRRGDPRPVPALPRWRDRGPPARREGEAAGRREGRPAHQGGQARRGRSQRRSAGRPLRGGEGAPARGVRPQGRARPHGARPGLVRRGRARRAGEGADARRAGHVEGEGRHPARHHAEGEGPRHRRDRTGTPATST